MKAIKTRKSGQGFRNATIVLATMLLVFSLSASAKTFDEKDPSFKAVAFNQVNSMIFKAVAKDINGSKIIVKILDNKGKQIYFETYRKANTYIRNFNFTDLEPGKYSFEISNGKDIYTQSFEIKLNDKKEIIVK